MKMQIDSPTSYRGRNARPNWFVLAAFVGSGLAAGAIGAFCSPGLSASAAVWYAALAKPPWVPPDNWFGPAWAALYVLMGTAAWLVWHERYHRSRNQALGAYALQFLLNAAWAPSFFGARSIGAGLFIIIALCVAIAWTVREFAAVKPAAAWMMLPYLGWVGFACALNYSLWKLNP